MIEIGRLCFKVAGREAGKLAVIIDIIDKNYVLIDGLVRRKKCNIAHLVPLGTVVKVKKGASTNEVHKAMIEAKAIDEVPKKGEPRPKKDKPKKQHVMKEKQAKEEKPKAETKKEEKPKKEEKKAEPKKAETKKEEKPKKESKPKKK
jgi:large subunit ribosomal protein L14e